MRPFRLQPWWLGRGGPQGSTDHRGTPEAPGRTATLVQEQDTSVVVRRVRPAPQLPGPACVFIQPGLQSTRSRSHNLAAMEEQVLHLARCRTPATGLLQSHNTTHSHSL